MSDIATMTGGMGTWGPIVEDLQRLTVDLLPQSFRFPAVATALAALAAGLAMGTLGAKIARYGVVVFFAIVGGWVGAAFAQGLSLSMPIGALLGAALIAAISAFTFRLWVGVAMSFVVGSLAMGAFGAWRLVPLLTEFAQQPNTVKNLVVDQGDKIIALSSAQDDTSQSPTTVEGEPSTAESIAKSWSLQYWSFVQTRDGDISRHGKALGAFSMLAGLLIGLIFTRACLIISSAAGGTILTIFGAGTLLSAWFPGFSQMLSANPIWLGAAIGVLFASSVILQALLNRKAPAPEKT